MEPSTSSSGEPPKSSKVESQSERLIPCLPDEVSLLILTRLPVKSLIKFTTISKPWNLLIKSSYFTKSHLSNSLSNPTYSHHHLLYSSNSYCDFRSTPLNSLLHHSSPVPWVTHTPIRPQRPYVSLVGSINGLLCVVSGDEASLWNPSLRKHMHLPMINHELGLNYERITYGFGYHAAANHYKVFAISNSRLPLHAYKNKVRVYSRKTESWKTIKGFQEDLLLWGGGVLVNKKIHWGTTSSSSPFKFRIMSIDVADETFEELNQPNYGEGEYYCQLGVIGECLCVLCDDGQTHVDFWVMKKYGVRDSWTKFASICLMNEVGYGSCRPPLCLLNNGKMLVCGPTFQPTNFHVYNPQDGSMNCLDTSNFHQCHDALVYVESLVLP